MQLWRNDMPLMELQIMPYSAVRTPSGQNKSPTFPLSAMPDTGANKSMISVNYFEGNNSAFQTSQSSRERQITVANSSHLPCLGEIDLALIYEDRTTPVHFLVCSKLQIECLLSWFDLQRMGVISSHFPQAIPANSTFQTVASDQHCLLYTSPSPRDRG